MNTQTEETHIDGVAYRMAKLPADKGVDIFAILFDTLAPGMSAMADLNEPGKSQGQVMQAAAIQLAKSLSSQKIKEVVEALAGVAEFDPEGGDQFRGLKPKWKLHFAGDLGGLIKWLKWGLEVQFGNLPDAFASLDLGFGGGPSTKAE